VYPEAQCVWVVAYQRAAQEGHVADMRRILAPIDQRKWGQSAWINFWQGRDSGQISERFDDDKGS